MKELAQFLPLSASHSSKEHKLAMDDIAENITENLVAAYKVNDTARTSLKIIVSKLLETTPEKDVASVLNDFIYDLLEPLL